MLSPTDRSDLIRAASQRGYTEAEIYSERTERTRIILHGRIEEVVFSEEWGIALSFKDGQLEREYSTTIPCKATLMAFIEGRPITPGVVRTKESPKRDVQTKKQILAQLFHGAGLDSTTSPRGVLRYEDRVTEFVFTSAERSAEGREENATVNVHWTAVSETGKTSHQWEESRRSIPALLRFLDESRLKRRVHMSMHPKPSWPAPQGELSVVWSSRATAKIFIQFLRAFEGDQFLQSPSFLAREARELGFRFSIDESETGFDHEGSVKKPVQFFHGGRPKALATNCDVATQLEVTSTGHSRRARFDQPSTVGLWAPRIVGLSEREELFQGLERAIAVEDVELEDYDAQQGTVHLLITEARLVHQGERGESIEPVRVALRLLELLRSFEHFSATREIHGFWISKDGQNFLTELETPATLTPRFQFPGTVPETHYW